MTFIKDLKKVLNIAGDLLKDVDIKLTSRNGITKIEADSKGANLNLNHDGKKLEVGAKYNKAHLRLITDKTSEKPDIDFSMNSKIR